MVTRCLKQDGKKGGMGLKNLGGRQQGGPSTSWLLYLLADDLGEDILHLHASVSSPTKGG